MYLHNVLSAALLLASATANTVYSEKRQLGGLSPLLGIISQVLPDSGAGGLPLASGTPGAVPGPAVPSTLPGVSSGAAADSSCTKAMQRINDAISLSSALTQSNGGKTTTQDILIVLAVLQKSLGENCNVAVGLGSAGGATSGGTRRIGSRDTASQQDGGPLSGIIGTGNNPNGILGDLLGGGRHDDNDDDDHHGHYDLDSDVSAGLGGGLRKDMKAESLYARATTQLENCTACEAALYSIVKQLQILFQSNGTMSIPGQPKLTAAAQRLRVVAAQNAKSQKRCEGAC